MSLCHKSVTHVKYSKMMLQKAFKYRIEASLPQLSSALQYHMLLIIELKLKLKGSPFLMMRGGGMVR